MLHGAFLWYIYIYIVYIWIRSLACLVQSKAYLVKSSNQVSKLRLSCMASAKQAMGSAKSKAANVVGEKKSVNQERDRMEAKITNTTPFSMTLRSNKNWAGEPVGAFPQVIKSNEEAKFTHAVQGAFGSSGAVIYSGLNGALQECAWLLAWDAPTNLTAETPNRVPVMVHVDCGRSSVIIGLPWSQIEMLLHRSPNSKDKDDTDTKTMVKAKFDEKIPEPATIEATFSLMI